MTNVTERPGGFIIRLRDGRRLQSLEVGKRDGSPIFHFQGNGSSRLEVVSVRALAEPLGVQLICLDRLALVARMRRRTIGCWIGPMM